MRYQVSELGPSQPERKIGRKSLAGAPARKNALALPDVSNGVRLFVRLTGAPLFESYRTPVVEVVADDGEWKTLARPTAAREIDASKLARWLRLCYPPGINEQLKPYDNVTGALTLRPAGDRGAVLAGDVRMSANGGAVFEGTLQALITYEGGRVGLRGIVEGTYPREERDRRRKTELKLVAAIESRSPREETGQ